MSHRSPLDLLIVGAGPAGLATALAAHERGLQHLVVDQGSVADAIRRFPTSMTFFSTSEQIEIGGVPFVSAGPRPTRIEAVRYYQAVAARRGLNVVPHHRVRSIELREDIFSVGSLDGTVWTARHVVVATGYFDTPRPIDVPGADLPLVRRYYDEPYAFSGLPVVVVGGKNSAVETALELFRAGAKVTLIHRGERLSDGVKNWILPDIQNRMSEGSIRAMFRSRVKAFHAWGVEVDGPEPATIECAAAFVMVGYAPDNRLLEQAGAAISPEIEGPFYDPATFETTVPGLYVAGSVAAGRHNNAIFIENGRLHGASIADAIARK
jgi:thioredoxin reductase (NADPH)